MLEQIFLADTAGDAPRAVNAVDVTEAGLVGDRYELGIGTFSQGLPDGRAVTLIDADVLEAIRGETGVDLQQGEHRRNLVTRGLDLPALVNRKFRIGTVLLRGNRPCPPCGRLSNLLGIDAKTLFHARGGLRADVLTPGHITAGDTVTIDVIPQP